MFGSSVLAFALASLSVYAFPPAARNLIERQTFVSNPYSFTVTAGSIVQTSATSHASYLQQVSIVNDATEAACIFQGSGESVQMLTLVSNSKTCSVQATETANLEVTFTFLYSSNGGTQWNSASVVSPIVVDDGPIQLFTITSEDGRDTDDNDTYLTVVLTGSLVNSTDSIVSPPSNSDFESAAVATGLGLHLTAKTQLTSGSSDEIDIAVDAFTGTSTTTGFTAAAGTWTKVAGKVWDDITTHPLLNYLVFHFEFSGSTETGLEGAKLTLQGYLPYTGERPTGAQAVEWTSTLTGTPVEVASIAN